MWAVAGRGLPCLAVLQPYRPAQLIHNLLHWEQDLKLYVSTQKGSFPKSLQEADCGLPIQPLCSGTYTMFCLYGPHPQKSRNFSEEPDLLEQCFSLPFSAFPSCLGSTRVYRYGCLFPLSPPSAPGQPFRRDRELEVNVYI